MQYAGPQGLGVETIIFDPVTAVRGQACGQVMYFRGVSSGKWTGNASVYADKPGNPSRSNEFLWIKPWVLASFGDVWEALREVLHVVDIESYAVHIAPG